MNYDQLVHVDGTNSSVDAADTQDVIFFGFHVEIQPVTLKSGGEAANRFTVQMLNLLLVKLSEKLLSPIRVLIKIWLEVSEGPV